MKPWGQLAAITLRGCDNALMKDKESLKQFAAALCKVIEMVPHGEPLVERFGEGDLEGYSMIQFIETSTLTVHLDEFGDRAFVDIFSCKLFDTKSAEEFSKNYFKAIESESKELMRG